MRQYGRGQEDGGTRRKLHHQTAIPQNEMSAFLWVEGAEGSHRTPTKGRVGKIGTFEMHRLGTEVVGDCSEDA